MGTSQSVSPELNLLSVAPLFFSHNCTPPSFLLPQTYPPSLLSFFLLCALIKWLCHPIHLAQARNLCVILDHSFSFTTVPNIFISKQNKSISASSSLTPLPLLMVRPSLPSALPASPAFLPPHCQRCSVPESIRLLLCCLQKQSPMSPNL